MLRPSYRYRLTREVSGGGERGELLWVCLNPSTADDIKDDQTVRSIRKITAAEGFGHLVVVNLFAARTTDPQQLLRFRDPIGPENGDVLRSEILAHSHVVFAWGQWLKAVSSPHPLAHGGHSPGELLYPPNVEAMVKAAKSKVWCLGKTKNGSPRHPCRIPNARLEPYY